MKCVLYCGLALPAISLLVWLFVRDYRGGGVSLKHPPSCIRLVSLALFLLLSAADICTGLREAGAGSPLLNLQMSGVVLLLSPHSYEKKNKDPLVFAAVFAAVCLLTSSVLSILGACAWKARLLPLLAVSGLTVNNWLCLRRRFSSVRTLFQNKSVWYAIEDYAGHCYVILLLSSICLAQLSAISQDLFSLFMLIPSLALLSVSVYGAYRKSADFSIIFLSAKQRLQIQNKMNGDVVERSSRADAKRDAMFSRIERYLTENQAYLEEDFSIVDLANAMLSNRVYVSKTINKVTGNNFCRLINTYRVAYSQKLWKLNPGLRLKEIYSRCGFNNMPSFIKAFKDITGHTPVEWLKETQVAKLNSASSAEEVAA